MGCDSDEGRWAVSVFLSSYRDVAAFRPEQFTPVVVGGSERVRVLVVGLEPGQFIPVHAPGVDLALVVLEGEGRVVAGDREEAVSAGSVAFIPAGQARGLKASSRLIALHVVAPPPTDADHAAVVAGLTRGDWR
jgi:quercetin dioxygenase-like cupin family protein